MESALGRSALLASLIAGAALVSAGGGCAGAAFSSPSDAGAGSGGELATGGVSAGGSANASGGRTTSGSGGVSRAGSGGSMPAQGGRLATGGVAGTAGKSSASGGVAAGGKSAASGGIAGTGGESHATGGEAPNGGSSVGGDPSTGGDPSLSEIPQDGLLLWLAADRGVVQSSGIVSKWQDQSAQHRDASQVVSGARPKRIEDAQNGLPMLEFDGVDDALALPEGLADFSTGVSFFSVVHLLEDGVCQSVLQLSNGPEIDDIDFGRFQGSVHYEVAAEYLTGQMDAFGLNQTVLMNYAQDVDGGVELRLDGQFIIAGSAMLPAVIPRVANFVGRSLYAECRFLSARVGEIVLYARPLASDERTQVEAYLRSKWGCCKI